MRLKLRGGMKMIKHQAVRRIQFCSGHRVYQHESKCANVHGHNYVAFFHAEHELDSIGRVIDFSVLKEKIGGWIDEYWDHGFIYFKNDGLLVELFTHTKEIIEGAESISVGKLNGHKSFMLPTNPTAENMAEYLLMTVCPLVLRHTGVIIKKVVLWETENCFAEVNIMDFDPKKIRTFTEG